MQTPRNSPRITDIAPVAVPLRLGSLKIEVSDKAEIFQEVDAIMNQENIYDVDIAIIGSGPGGYVAAIRAAQLGAHVVVIEKNQLGGTCLNVGCIPTKAMIGSADRLAEVKSANELGILIDGEIHPDFTRIMDRKTRIVNQFVGGVGFLFKKNQIQLEKGTGQIIDPHTVEITGEQGTHRITTRAIIIATGSIPAIAPIPGLDAPDILTSDDAVSLSTLPESLLIIGGGAIGLEFGYIYNRFGTSITVVEMMDQILPGTDREIASELEKILKRQGIQVYTASKLNRIDDTPDGKTALITTPKGDIQITAQKVLRAVGRWPYTGNLNLDKLGIRTERRAIQVNDYMETSVPGIYAIGDVIGGYLLAHVASEEGIIAVENIMGHPAKMDYRAVPSAVYTNPELATVGLSEENARKQGYSVKIGKFPFRINGKALSIGERDGFVKFVTDGETGEILGVHILGPHATDLLAEAVLAIKMEMTVEEIFSTIHAHPTLTEVTNEAAMDAAGRGIHQ